MRRSCITIIKPLRGYFKNSCSIPSPLGCYDKCKENHLDNFPNTQLLAAGIENFRYDYLFWDKIIAFLGGNELAKALSYYRKRIIDEIIAYQENIVDV